MAANQTATLLAAIMAVLEQNRENCSEAFQGLRMAVEEATGEWPDDFEAAEAEDFRLRAYGHDEGEYVAGCGQDDTRDAKGRPLLSRYNEAGEPRW